MAVIAKQRYKLDIAPKGGWVVVYASQHDDEAREIEFEITNQGNSYSIPASINVSVQGIKSNKSYFSHSCSYSGNIVTMALADDMTDIVGKAICVLKFTNSSNQKLATAKFVLNVDTDSSSEGVIVDTEAEEIFNQMLNEIRAQASAISVNIAELQSMVGSPLVASTVSKMTDHNKIYVYTGSESGYTNGNWYYWNGSAWTSGGVYNSTAFETDPTLTLSGQAADAGKVGVFKEYTRNLNVSEMGQYGNANDGRIYDRDGRYYGMKDFISVDPNTAYIISVGGVSGTSPIISILQINDDSTINRSGFANINNRTIITGANTIKLHVHVYSTIVLTLNNPFIQIEKGDNATNHIIPISAIDAVLREKQDYPTFVFKDAVGAMVDVAKTYFDIAYGDNTNLVYDSTHGLFALQTTSDNTGEEGMHAIVCSMLAWAMMKGIPYENSRYVKTLNHIAQWGYTSDGKEQTTQDGEPYSNSYYNYLNGAPINTDDYPSYDYMLAAETYRYALNHGWAYDIDAIRPQLRAGDFVFSVDAEVGQYKYKNITHIALVLFVGQDNGRVVLLESNTFTYGNRENIGVGIRYANISSLSYGARFPIGGAPYEVSLVEKAGAFSGESEAGAYNFKTIFTKTHESGFYTVIMEGDITVTAGVHIGVVYDNDTSARKYYRLMIQGNKIIGFFYAPSSFRNISLAGDPVVTYGITECNLYKGYMPC